MSDPTAAGSGTAAASSAASPPRTLYILLQLLLALLVVRQFEIESRRYLYPLMAIVMLGFLVHLQLPRRWQPAWFVTLGVIALFVLLGWPAAGIALGIAMALIGVCLLPIGHWWRVLLLLGAGASLIWFRVGSTSAMWPVVGSLFMFRSIVFFFDTRHRRERPEFWPTVSYFLLLPNFFFVLFPVVDYATFCRTRTKSEAEDAIVRQTGINWIVLGVLHLLLYRMIRYWVLPAPLTIHDAPTLMVFLAANYGLYLHISGQFHLAIGVLHLFGFNLPRTHDWFFLASSFTDIWRRINIYWKDFMAKVFFIPIYFRLRRPFGDQLALVSAVCCVFVATWLAHSWQVFWLLGEFPFNMLDAQLWLGAGVFVAMNSLLDYRFAQRQPAKTDLTLGRAVRRSVQTLAVFSIVCLFWARWTNPELPQLLAVFGPQRYLVPGQLGIVAAVAVILVLAGVGLQYLLERLKRQSVLPIPATSPKRVLANTAVLAGLLLLTTPFLQDQLGTETGRVIASFQSDHFTKTESSRLVQGYYEELNEGSLQAGLWSDRLTVNAQYREIGRQYDDATYPRNDLLEMELVPNWAGDLAGTRFTVNRWGMRDRDFDKAKPPGTWRIGLIGSSVIMGYGVKDEEVVGRVLERELNAAPRPEGIEQYEVLNFAQGRYGALHRQMWLEERGFEFDLDAILYFAHQDELIMPVSQLTRMGPGNYPIDNACLQELLKQAHLDQETSVARLQQELPAIAFEIVRCCYEQIVADCRQRGIVPVWIELPIPGNFELPIDPAGIREIARESGFIIFDCTDWADGYTEAQVKIDAHHPSTIGHQLIVTSVVRQFRLHPDVLSPGE